MTRTLPSAALLALAGLGCTRESPAPDPEPAAPAATGLRIALQANAHGDIEPCG